VNHSKTEILSCIECGAQKSRTKAGAMPDGWSWHSDKSRAAGYLVYLCPTHNQLTVVNAAPAFSQNDSIGLRTAMLSLKEYMDAHKATYEKVVALLEEANGCFMKGDKRKAFDLSEEAANLENSLSDAECGYIFQDSNGLLDENGEFQP
jgi:hypothetical protein